MAGLNHDFFLYKKIDLRKHEYVDASKFENRVVLHHNLVCYFRDTFKFIPSINIAMPNLPRMFGLNGCGITGIDGRGAQIAKNIFSGWVEIFSSARKNIILRGEWTGIVGEPGGHYSKITISKQDMLDKLTKLVSFSETVLASDGELVLYHRGI